MATKPNIQWIGSPNHSSLKDYKFIAIVDHIMSGTLVGTDSWFLNSASQVSSHFGVGKNGEIHQYVDTDYPAWANGSANNPDWNLLKSGVNPNYYTISIEHEGESGDVMPEAQYKSTLALHRWLIDELDIPIDDDHIIGHYRIDSVNKSNCPGSGFPWERLFKDLKNNSNGDEFQMEHAIFYFTENDKSLARMINKRLGNCAMYCRDGDSNNIHSDIKYIKHPVFIGGKEYHDNSNTTNLCGYNDYDTAELAARYARQLDG